MKECIFCGAELEEGMLICPACGKEQEEPACDEACSETQVVAEESAAAEQDGYADPWDVETGEERKPKKKALKIAAFVLAGVVLLGVLAAAVIYGLGIDVLRIFRNDVTRQENYTVSDSVLAEEMGTVIATAGEDELTNAEFQLYYWSCVMQFLNNYGAYGIVDTTKGLHEQTWDENWTYQQFFVDMAVESWKDTKALCALAQNNGFELPEETKAELEALPQQLQGMLGETYATVDEMLQDQLFPGVNEAGYLNYINDNNVAYGYLEILEASFDPTDEQLEAYFDAHADGYAENGITKESMRADVRHILLEPANGTVNEANVAVYPEADWADCLVKAQNLLTQWKNGAATEESFAALANTHSVDPGSNTTGGLYENITPTTNFVPTFLNWTVDPTRKIGDTDIVKSDYGYHIMYYVGGEPLWPEVAEADYIAENTQAAIDAGKEELSAKVKFSKIVLGHMSLTG